MEGGSRLIPARAGNTLLVAAMIIAAAAHPRSRGEHTTVCKTHLTGCGSSPLARGTPFTAWSTYQKTRLIPARAGNTKTLRPIKVAAMAHPRSRGEHTLSPSDGCGVGGSSPLARGTRPPCPRPDRRRRLIPARAGNTQGACRPQRSAAAHPRSRGEHVRGLVPRSRGRGSSPLARGTR